MIFTGATGGQNAALEGDGQAEGASHENQLSDQAGADGAGLSAEERWPERKGAWGKFYLFWHEPQSSKASAYTHSGILFLIFFSVLVFMIQTLPAVDPAPVADAARSQELKDIWEGLEASFISVFTLEYICKLISADNKLGFVRDFMNIIDLLAILPFYINLILEASLSDGGGGDIVYLAVLRAMRLFRVFRVLKLGKYFQAIQMVGTTIIRSGTALMTLLFIAVICTVLFSAAIYFAEGVGFPTHGFCYKEGTTDLVSDEDMYYDYCNGFSSIPDAMWWTLITMSTVGYGDVSPKTPVGKFIGTVCAITGILALALPITVIGSNFSAIFSEEMEQREKEANAKKEEEAGADPKERLVGELRRVLKAHGAEFSNKPLKLVLLSGDDVTAISTN